MHYLCLVSFVLSSASVILGRYSYTPSCTFGGCRVGEFCMKETRGKTQHACLPRDWNASCKCKKGIKAPKIKKTSCLRTGCGHAEFCVKGKKGKYKFCCLPKDKKKRCTCKPGCFNTATKKFMNPRDKYEDEYNHCICVEGNVNPRCIQKGPIFRIIRRKG